MRTKRYWDSRNSKFVTEQKIKRSSIRAAFDKSAQSAERKCLCGEQIEKDRPRSARLCWGCNNKVMERRAEESARRWR